MWSSPKAIGKGSRLLESSCERYLPFCLFICLTERHALDAVVVFHLEVRQCLPIYICRITMDRFIKEATNHFIYSIRIQHDPNHFTDSSMQIVHHKFHKCTPLSLLLKSLCRCFPISCHFNASSHPTPAPLSPAFQTPPPASQQPLGLLPGSAPHIMEKQTAPQCANRPPSSARSAG